MYSLKVRGVVQTEDKTPQKGASKEGAGSSAQASPSSAVDADPLIESSAAAAAGEVDQLSFSAGNPRVEHITGLVHLYRHITEDAEPSSFENDAKPPPPTTTAAVTPPPERSAQLCVISLPPDMGFPEFCTFLGAYFERVKEIRLVRRDLAARASCLVLLRFDAQEAADGFYTDFNGKPFCMLEPELICRLLYVKDVEILDGAASPSPLPSDRQPTSPQKAKKSSSSSKTTKTKTTTTPPSQENTLRPPPPPPPPPPPGTTELPSCPVCLERLDEHISGIVTTVCNHKFHNQCLRQWGDSSCPVCRYCQHPTEAASSHCTSCGTTADLWACLVCGHVGCGRYRGSHAAEHWNETGHGYALELGESQAVWSYAADVYVHRLVRSKTDGKIVEVPGGGNGGGGDGECSSNQQYSSAGLDADVEEAMVASKLDVLSQEYNALLVSQLEAQRQHFEGLVEKVRLERDAVVAEEREKTGVAVAAAEKAGKAAVEADKKHRHVSSKLAETSGKLQAALKEKEFLKQLNDTLLANQKQFAEKLKAAESKAGEQAAVIKELEEQVRDLMFFLEAQQTIAGSGGGEGAGGTVLPVPAPPRRRKKK